MNGNVGIALLLTVIAGLSTGIGSGIAYFIKRPKIVYLAFALGLSAGVMIYISFMEMLPDALETLGEGWGLLVFFVGIGVMALIDLLVPEQENPHNYEDLEEPTAAHGGLVTFAAALSDVKLGAFIAIAIAIHNVPEGIAVSVPIFYATKDKNKAFFYSFLSGVSEPAGALLGYLVLMPFLTPAVLAGTLAFVAGVMIYISLDELLPTAHRYGHGHLVISGVVLGMLIMALSLLML